MPTWNRSACGRLLLLVTTLLVAACATPRTVPEAQDNDRRSGAAIGAGVGGGAGYLIDKFAFKDNGAAGAVLGAAAGSLLGYMAGDITAQKRGEYAQEQNEIETAIIAEEQRITELTNQVNRLETESKSRASTIAMLRRQAIAKGRMSEQAKTALASAEADLDKAMAMRLEVKRYKNDIDAKIMEIEQIQAINGPENDPQKLRHQKTELIAKRDKLIKAFTTLNGVTEVLVAQSTQLNALAKS